MTPEPTEIESQRRRIAELVAEELGKTTCTLVKAILPAPDKEPKSPMTIPNIIQKLTHDPLGYMMSDLERDLKALVKDQARRDAQLCCSICNQAILKAAGLHG